jgi:hypothetical protein
MERVLHLCNALSLFKSFIRNSNFGLKKLKNKYLILCIGFFISWLYAIFIFYPQPGVDGWIGTAFLTLLYGFSWIIPITLILLGITKKENTLRIVISNKYFTIGLIIALGTALLISWNIIFSNDLVFIGFWILTTLLWLNVYLNLRSLNRIYRQKVK